MMLAALDLNLLVSLDALLQERSVTRAADLVGVSQPTMSTALSRLRRHFGDDLLTRVGNSYELTPLAAKLGGQTGAALADIERIFLHSSHSDAIPARKEFTVLGSDYAMAILGEPLASLVAARAPNVRLRFEHHHPSQIERGIETLRSVDALILPHGYLLDTPHCDLFTDRWVFLVAADNPSIGEHLSMDDLRDMPWVLTYHSQFAFTAAGRQLQMLGIEPHVQFVVESFLALAPYVVHSDRIALIQERAASLHMQGGGLRCVPCPFDVVPLTEALWWHPMQDDVADNVWLRNQFIDAGRQVEGIS